MSFRYTLFFLLYSLSGLAQESNPEIDSLYALAISDAPDTSRIDAYNTLAIKHRNMGNLDSALVLAQSAIDLAEPLTHNSNERVTYKAMKGVANGYNTIGSVHSILGNLDKSLENYFVSLRVKEHNNDSIGMAGAYNNIGSTYQKLERFDDAIHYFHKAIPLNIRLDNKQWLSYNYNNLGMVHMDLDEYDVALEKFDSSLMVKTELGDSVGIAMSYNNIASIYEDYGEIDTAIYLVLKALPILQRAGQPYHEAMTQINLARLYNGIAKYDLAQIHLNRAQEISEPMQVKDHLSSIYFTQHDLDQAKGDYQSSLENYKMYIVYRDSLKDEEMIEQSIHAEMSYKFSQKEMEARLRESERHSEYIEEINKRKIQRNFFIAGFIIVAILGLFIFRSYRAKKQSNALLSHQKMIIEEKQEEILDSIRYAKRIQDAILPSWNFVKEYLPESFVLYKPKDVVAGDFYWFDVLEDEQNKSETILIAAADCTGHGVPGAMVSVICNNGIQRAVREYGLKDPGKILNKTRELVIEKFEKSEDNVRDGMDIALVALEKNQSSGTVKLSYAGANNPLWIIREGTKEVEEIKPDKQPIGTYVHAKEFTTHSVELNTGDRFYIFSDGFADQFGGEKGKKLKNSNFKEIVYANHTINMADQEGKFDQIFENWKGDLEQLDDICVIGVRI